MITVITDNLGVEHPMLTCDVCHRVVVRSPHNWRIGYVTDRDGRDVCYRCCGDIDRAATYNLPIGGKTHLYDCAGRLTNWPDTFSVLITYRKRGRHNVAHVRYDMWFELEGEDGRHFYHAVRYGDNTQVAHVTRVKG